jgi:hypothetical protein
MQSLNLRSHLVPHRDIPQRGQKHTRRPLLALVRAPQKPSTKSPVYYPCRPLLFLLLRLVSPPLAKPLEKGTILSNKISNATEGAV